MLATRNGMHWASPNFAWMTRAFDWPAGNFFRHFVFN
jgi:hypothetical protein